GSAGAAGAEHPASTESANVSNKTIDNTFFMFPPPNCLLNIYYYFILSYCINIINVYRLILFINYDNLYRWCN
ncbi:MAG TPA: hypothetical protein PKU88_12035, partial [Bacillota bacterium]|nr:hypothetical protein [Bacillota bacterium]